MIKKIQIAMEPSFAYDEQVIKQVAANELACSVSEITQFRIVKRSLDARSSRNIVYILQLEVALAEQLPNATLPLHYKDVHNAKEVHIVGAGPAGLFAALHLIELGLKPIVMDRGKNVRDRRRDLALLNKEGILNEESNYCFGEGGAGTYSDGKLYTRSNKRGNIQKILQIFHRFGAHENILTDAHPHIGTNKLPQIIAAMRNQIIECGGQVLFETKLEDILLNNNTISQIVTSRGVIDCSHLILATGHSARDIYELLDRKNILIDAKPLAIGVRVEHPQQFIDKVQYKCDSRGDYLPPAAYSLVDQVNGRGVFSFCMCPGGVIAPASTQAGKLVVNGWSPSKRNNPYANSGMVVSVNENDYKSFSKYGALASLHYQSAIEEKAYAIGGGNYQAPAQRITDFVNKKTSKNLPACSYLRGVVATNLTEVLPSEIINGLIGGFQLFDKKMRGFLQQDAIVVATESRTSAPVRIPRDNTTKQHVQISGLYPCAEGAGYAGGIVSAAMDGELVAFAVHQSLI
jgi:uncharacterized protein